MKLFTCPGACAADARKRTAQRAFAQAALAYSTRRCLFVFFTPKQHTSISVKVQLSEANPNLSAAAAPRYVAVIGGGLAGCECALTLARRGIAVKLYEMRPQRQTPAHETGLLAEMVCSNSFRSEELASGIGLLKAEMTDLGSPIMAAAQQTRVPAGKALAVDRELFARAITAAIEAEPLITLIRREITSFNDPELADPRLGPAAIVMAAGPLASDALSADLARILGAEQLYFYDAIAPIVSAESVDMSVAFWGSRYNPEEHDYLNCPFSREEYFQFREALLAGQKVPCREFEKEIHFEGCMPVEALAERGEMTLAFGSLKPVGFTDPRTGARPFAVLQLRPENANKSAFNLVGCQTKLTYAEQERIFRMVPGLAQAEFLRLGSMHRNTYVNAPEVLNPDLSLRAGPPGLPPIYLAGQITGVEGYLESAATGLWLGLDLAARLSGAAPDVAPDAPPPPETALGALLAHLQRPAKHFQPSNINFGLMPEPELRLRKKDRKAAYADRAREAFRAWLNG